MAREIPITKEGLEKLEADIAELSTVRRREVAERIKEAREFGDIAENSEYDDAKNDQAMLEQRIAQMEERIRELERQLGRKTMEVEILREALDKALSKKPTLLAKSPLRDGSR